VSRGKRREESRVVDEEFVVGNNDGQHSLRKSRERIETHPSTHSVLLRSWYSLLDPPLSTRELAEGRRLSVLAIQYNSLLFPYNKLALSTLTSSPNAADDARNTPEGRITHDVEKRRGKASTERGEKRKRLRRENAVHADEEGDWTEGRVEHGG
jgi:hypothetical protein